jgi:hypothetical protein
MCIREPKASIVTFHWIDNWMCIREPKASIVTFH